MPKKTPQPNQQIRLICPEFRPDLLQLARMSAGMSQTELSQQSRISQSKISKLESGVQEPSPEQLDALAQALDVEVAFFAQPQVLWGTANSLFRSNKLPRKVQDRLSGDFTLLRLTLLKMLQAVELEQRLALPSRYVRGSELSPEGMAQQVRRDWMIPNGPIGDLLAYMESAGILVVPMLFLPEKCDAVWIQGESQALSIIGYDPNAPGDRLRFNLAHELGHHLMHFASYSDKDCEDEANRFAAELLMPEGQIRPWLQSLNLQKALNAKMRWKVSMQSLIFRAKHLREISGSRYTNLMAELSRQGWRTNEPGDIPQEEPNLIKQLIRLHLEELGYTVDELAKAMRVKPHKLYHLYGHLIEHQPRPILRLVR